MARLLEHDALSLLKQSGIAVPAFEAVSSAEAAKESALRLGCPVVIKALIPVGGRRKAGAILMAHSADDAFERSRELLGKTILNFPVEQLVISEALEISKEFFVSITFDSMSRKPTILFSSLGGVDVETILERDPNRLVQMAVDISVGLQPLQAREIVEGAALEENALEETAEILSGLYRLFRRLDAETIEVNPLVLTKPGAMMVPSAVIVIDNQALFRHPELKDMADPDRTNGWRPLTPLEREMRAIDRIDPGSAIRFNELDGGDTAFMITGGGAGFLAFDSIMQLGGKPATTFDITPGRVEEKMYLATKAILSKAGLKGMIAGGNITNFIPIDIKVRGVMRALMNLKVDPKSFPVVFRFAGPGTEVAKGLASELPGIEYYDAATSLEEAINRIIELIRDK
jgi:succinyl-CoA synthetase beta subunit/citryl-CoA synthetase large subunit